ncbi:MAG: DUF4129 domain-containing protein [Thermoplasmata archaeon]|nr:DUF4129 domain-containing protein [Thermoplasmata archaeon]
MRNLWVLILVALLSVPIIPSVYGDLDVERVGTHGGSIPAPFEPCIIREGIVKAKEPTSPTDDGRQSSRIVAINTSVFFQITKWSLNVDYGETFQVEGILYEDNNSNEARESGEMPVEGAWIKIIWDDASPYVYETAIKTQYDDPDNNQTGGFFQVNLTANDTVVGVKELRIIFPGQWTINGLDFYNLTEYDIEHLAGKAIGVDDDGDDRIDEEGYYESSGGTGGYGYDDDGDGLIDEDPFAFIARRPFEKRLYIAIWHKVDLVASVDRQYVVVGNSFNISGHIEDTSVPETFMGQKTLKLFFDGQYYTDIVTESHGGSDPKAYFKAEFVVPLSVEAGPHTVLVDFQSSYNTATNMYYRPGNFTLTIYVQRPTMILFDASGEETWVYRTYEVTINGSVVDYWKYQLDHIREGPKLKIGEVTFTDKYQISGYWGERGMGYYENLQTKYLTDPNGTFSFTVLVKSSQPLGEVPVTVRFMPRRLADGRQPYYLPSQNTTTYVVRAHTKMELSLEMEDTENVEKVYITRRPYQDPQGNIHRWNVVHVRVQLMDVELSTPTVPKGVPGQEIRFWWGYRTNYEKFMTGTTDSNGEVVFDINIEPTHPLGPVPILATFVSNRYVNYYDGCMYSDTDGDPFSVVSITRIVLQSGTGVKGEKVMITGMLLDDSGRGIPGRKIQIYWQKGEVDYTQIYKNPGKHLGNVTTDGSGQFTFDSWTIPAVQKPGEVIVLAKFEGSPEFPEGPNGPRFYPNDAYMPSFSAPTPFNVTARTVIKLNPIPGHLTRGNPITVSGRMVERYQNRVLNYGVPNAEIRAYIIQGTSMYELGKTITSSAEGETMGTFTITGRVPIQLKVGTAVIKVVFRGNEKYLNSEAVVTKEVWSATVVEILEYPPDEDGDGLFDLYQDSITPENPLHITVMVTERNPTEIGKKGQPIAYGKVILTISYETLTNTTVALTDTTGRFTFNFTSTFTDTAHGTLFAAKEPKSIMINVTFAGMDYYEPNNAVVYGMYHPPKPKPKREPMVGPLTLKQFLVLLLVIVLMAIIVLYAAYRKFENEIRKRQLKRIFRRSRDRLIVGNKYKAEIFNVYKELTRYLKRYGYMRRKADTYREFEEAVRAALPIDAESMDLFLDVLEEAHYSDHVITEEHRKKAIDAFERIYKSVSALDASQFGAVKALAIEEEEAPETEIIYKEGAEEGVQ